MTVARTAVVAVAIPVTHAVVAAADAHNAAADAHNAAAAVAVTNKFAVTKLVAAAVAAVHKSVVPPGGVVD